MKMIYLVLMGLLGLHLFLLANLQFTAWPEMFSYPLLHNNGFKLYADMVYAYSPFLTFILAFLYKIFGYNLIVLKIFTWVGILGSDILIFLITKQLTGKNIFAFLSLIFYLVTQPFLDGNMLWFDTALTLPILLVIYFRKNPILAGIFLSAALLTKQTAVFFIAAYFFYARSFRFLIPVAISVAIFAAWLVTTRQTTGFYNWNFYYPATFWTKYPSYEILFLTRRDLLNVFLVLLPSVAVFIKKRKPIVLFLFLLAGIIAVYPRFSFYHFQPALAISAILFGLCIKYFRFSYILYTIYFILLVSFVSLPVLKSSWQKETRFWGTNDLSLAQTIQSEVTGPVYLLGPHSALYVMSGKLPPKPWVDNFGWYFEIPGVQGETIHRWEQNPPSEIIWQDPQMGKWYEIGTYQPRKIVEWVMANYNKKREIEAGVWLWVKK